MISTKIYAVITTFASLISILNKTHDYLMFIPMMIIINSIVIIIYKIRNKDKALFNDWFTTIIIEPLMFVLTYLFLSSNMPYLIIIGAILYLIVTMSTAKYGGDIYYFGYILAMPLLTHYNIST